MPRRPLILLTALVLAAHWLALAGLPLGGGAPGAASETLAFRTRLVEPPAPPPPAAAEPKPAPRPAPKPRPKPRPAPPPPPPAPTPEPAPQAAAAEPAYVPDPHELLAAAAPPEMSPETPASEPAAEPAAESASAAEAASDAASAPAEAIPTAAPAAPPASDAAPQVTQADTGNAPQASAGVEITPPGAAGAPSGGEAPPVRVPASVRLDFEVTGQAKRFNYSASAELSWRQDGARYEARQQVKAFLLGARSQTSTGRITARGLQPERFGDKARSERAAHFDFEQHQATFSANAPPAPIGDGAQDRLSVFIQLGSLLAAAPQRYPPGTRIALTTVGTKSADRWTFTVEGPETLQLPAGPTPALKLQRVPPPGKEYDQKAELWLGTELGYLPVRIRITQANGDFADLALSGHEAQ